MAKIVQLSAGEQLRALLDLMHEIDPKKILSISTQIQHTARVSEFSTMKILVEVETIE